MSRQTSRHWSALFVLSAVLLLASCDSKEPAAPEEKPTPADAVSTETSAAVTPPQTIQTGIPPEFAGVPRTEVAAWTLEPPRGNFATLAIQGEKGWEPLSIDTLDIKVSIEGRLARTEVTQVFRNHQSQQAEGTYEFTLPDGAAISRLAMDVEGVMTEGELVERERARQIYEEIVHRKKDPALLEWQGGNRFKTQIFPIPPSGTKTVILGYEQVLPETLAGVRYVYALPHLQGDVAGSHIGAFIFALTAKTKRDVEVSGYDAVVEHGGNGASVNLSAQDFVPNGPVEVRMSPMPNREPDRLQGYRVVDGVREDFFMIDTVPEIPALTEGNARDVVLALDTSAGLGTPVLEQAKRTASLLLDALPAGTRVDVVYGDLQVASCSPTPVALKDKASLVECIQALEAGGATNLSELIQRSIELAKTFEKPVSIILITDGVASVGELDGELIRAKALAAIAENDIALHTLAIGHGPAEEDLALLAAAGRGHSLRMSPVDNPEDLVAAVLEKVREPLLTEVTVEVMDGEVEALTPMTPFNLARGEGAAILGRLMSPTAELRLRGNYAGQTVENTFRVQKESDDPESSLLTNFWARAAIGASEAAGDPSEQIVKMSLKYGVMSRQTSFLVLENDEAYERYQVERRKEAEKQRAQAQAAQVQEDAVAAPVQNLRKSDDDLSKVLDRPTPASDSQFLAGGEALESMGQFDSTAAAGDTAGNYGLGMSVAGRGGGGGGPNAGGFGVGNFGASDDRRSERRSTTKDKSVGVPRLKMGMPEVSGSLDKRIIKKVVNQHKIELKSCYERELAKHTGLHGKIVVKWTIDATGNVPNAIVVSTTMNNATVEQCLAGAVKFWRFPAPKGGGLVIVSYPFAFGGGDDDEVASYAERIAELEKKAQRSTDEHMELMSFYLGEGDSKKAEAYLEANWSAFDKEPNAVRFAFLNSPEARKLFPKEFTALALEAAKENPLALLELRAYYLESSQYERILTDIAPLQNLPSGFAEETLELVVTRDPATAGKLFGAWFGERKIVPASVFVNHKSTAEAFPKEAFESARDLFERQDHTFDGHLMLDVLVASALATKQEDEAIQLLSTRCLSLAERSDCAGGIRAFGSHPAVEPALATLVANELAAVLEARQTDIGNSELISRQSGLLREMGHAEEAARVLSEIVEFAPHDFATRTRYAVDLQEVGDEAGACLAYAEAVQLDPAQRDTFRTMMSARRRDGVDAENIKTCIVEGVSNLPVRRDISLVMTWEDSTADVDLHIEEASGEEVWYQHRTSAAGGLLYYDITDGYGPEIYVLGTGPKGTYELSVVYFRGSQQNLRGTLTILEKAGSAAETRREIPFVLPIQDNEKKISLGKLVLE